MLKLRPLLLSDERAFREAVAEFKAHDPDWGFAFYFDETPDFAKYVELVNGWAAGRDIGSFVPNTYLVAVVGDKIVGRMSLRHELNEFLKTEGGHIGYGVVPSERRKGYAKAMLGLALPIAKQLGLTRVLVTCDDDNVGSARTIEAHGGVLQDKIMRPDGNISTRRYWIDL